MLRKAKSGLNPDVLKIFEYHYSLSSGFVIGSYSLFICKQQLHIILSRRKQNPKQLDKIIAFDKFNTSYRYLDDIFP